MNYQSPYPIAVIGDGIIGLVSALWLATNNIPVILVKGTSKSPVGDWDSRTYALNLLSCDMLEMLGILQELKRCSHFESMRVWDKQGACLHFSASDIGETKLGVVVEHRVLSEVLNAKLNRDTRVIQLTKELTAINFGDTSQSSKLHFADGGTYDVAFVIGADGGRSIVRQQAGIECSIHDYHQVAQAAIVATEHNHRFQCVQQFSARFGVTALLPLSERVCSAIRMHQDALEDAEFEDFFSKNMPLGDVRLLSRPLTFPLVGRIVRQYVTPNCALVGDAAHSIHPLAGQGANLGFGDLAILFSVLKQSESNHFSWSILRAYQRKVVLNNQMTKCAMEALFKVNGRSDMASQKLRKLVCKLVDENLNLRRVFIRNACGLNYETATL